MREDADDDLTFVAPQSPRPPPRPSKVLGGVLDLVGAIALSVPVLLPIYPEPFTTPPDLPPGADAATPLALYDWMSLSRSWTLRRSNMISFLSDDTDEVDDEDEDEDEEEEEDGGTTEEV